MKSISAFILFTILAASVAYDDLDDTIDFEEMLKTPSELRALLDCYLDTIPCPPKFIPYRKHAEEAVDDGCRECSSLQKHHVKQILTELKSLFPEDFAKLAPKYDKDGKATHFNNLMKEVEGF